MRQPLNTQPAFIAPLVGLAVAVLMPLCALAQDRLRVNVFPGATNVPIFMAQKRGLFERAGLTVDIINTPNSNEQRAGLAAGKFDIAHAAVDNAVAMVETAKHDVVIVMGGDSGMNELMVQADIQSVAEVKGKTLAVDAPNTAYALIAKKILKQNGLLEGRDYKLDAVGGSLARAKAMIERKDLAAGMLNAPFTYQAFEKGLKSLGQATKLVGPYQATGAFVMREWAAANAAVLERYLESYIQGQRLCQDPTNRPEVIDLLVTRVGLSKDVAEKTYASLMVEGSGLSKDARLSDEGFRNVLAIRADVEGTWGGTPPAASRYLELSYFNNALERVKAR